MAARKNQPRIQQLHNSSSTTTITLGERPEGVQRPHTNAREVAVDTLLSLVPLILVFVVIYFVARPIVKRIRSR